jgi:hypothetical protein
MQTPPRAPIEERDSAEKEATAASGSGDRSLAAFRAPARFFQCTGVSSAQFRMLTKSNYTNWPLLMQVILQARDLWTTMTTGHVEYTDDRAAMEATSACRAARFNLHPLHEENYKGSLGHRALSLRANRVRESRASSTTISGSSPEKRWATSASTSHLS